MNYCNDKVNEWFINYQHYICTYDVLCIFLFDLFHLCYTSLNCVILKNSENFGYKRSYAFFDKFIDQGALF